MESNELQQKLVELLPEMEKAYFKTKEEIILLYTDDGKVNKKDILDALEEYLFDISSYNDQKLSYELDLLELRKKTKNYKDIPAKRAELEAAAIIRNIEKKRLKLSALRQRAEVLLEIYQELE